MLQERHVALGFQEALFEALPVEDRAALLEKVYGQPPKAAPDDAIATQGELRSRLMKAGCPGFIEETPVPFTEAIDYIRGLGAITVYPTLADGVVPICGYEDLSRISSNVWAATTSLAPSSSPCATRQRSSRSTSRPGATRASS